MSDPTFSLVEIESLRVHEEIDPAEVAALARRIREERVVQFPIWVARGSLVILNGHHRYHALRSLGAPRVPAWMFDYDDARVELARWSDGPPVSKAEVVRRALEGRPFPPKTTRHTLTLHLPERPTPLAELLAPSARGTVRTSP